VVCRGFRAKPAALGLDIGQHQEQSRTVVRRRIDGQGGAAVHGRVHRRAGRGIPGDAASDDLCTRITPT
jgi:hypothetical protein